MHKCPVSLLYMNLFYAWEISDFVFMMMIWSCNLKSDCKAKSLHLMIFLCLLVFMKCKFLFCFLIVTPHFGYLDCIAWHLNLDTYEKCMEMRVSSMMNIYTCSKPFTLLFLQIYSIIKVQRPGSFYPNWWRHKKIFVEILLHKK